MSRDFGAMLTPFSEIFAEIPLHDRIPLLKQGVCGGQNRGPCPLKPLLWFTRPTILAPTDPLLKERNPDAATSFGENFSGPEGPEAVLFGVQPQGLRPMGFEVGEQQQKRPQSRGERPGV